jgi:hypothetical protein
LLPPVAVEDAAPLVPVEVPEPLDEGLTDVAVEELPEAEAVELALVELDVASVEEFEELEPLMVAKPE